MNGRSYTVLHVHNESSASGQATEEEGPGSGKTGGGSSASGQATEEEGPGSGKTGGGAQ